MFCRPLSPRHCLTVWILVADSREARIYLYQQATQERISENRRPVRELTPVPDSETYAETLDNYQINHQLRGAAFNSASSHRNTYEPQGTIKKELQRRFIESLSLKLQHAYNERLFDKLILVAPAKIIGELRQQLPAKIQECVAAVLPKDLATYSGDLLYAHLQDTLAEI